MREKKNIRYKNSREKPLNQEIQSFSSESQSGYKKEDVQNQGVLSKDNMPTEVKTSSSKKTFINQILRFKQQLLEIAGLSRSVKGAFAS